MAGAAEHLRCLAGRRKYRPDALVVLLCGPPVRIALPVLLLVLRQCEGCPAGRTNWMALRHDRAGRPAPRARASASGAGIDHHSTCPHAEPALALDLASTLCGVGELP